MCPGKGRKSQLFDPPEKAKLQKADGVDGQKYFRQAADWKVYVQVGITGTDQKFETLLVMTNTSTVALTTKQSFFSVLFGSKICSSLTQIRYLNNEKTNNNQKL